jgi:hypothetical protein
VQLAMVINATATRGHGIGRVVMVTSVLAERKPRFLSYRFVGFATRLVAVLQGHLLLAAAAAAATLLQCPVLFMSV